MTQDNLNGAADRSSEEALRRLFTLPEGPDSALSVMEQKLSQNLAGFLRENIVAIEKPLVEIERDFAAHEIPEVAASVSDYAEEMMRTATHDHGPPAMRIVTTGFRCVLGPAGAEAAAILPPLAHDETPPDAAPDNGEGVEKRLVGTWETKAPNPAGGTFTFRWEQDADGSYRVTGGPFPDTGTLTASGGHIQQYSETARQSVAVTYRFKSSTQLLTEGPLGPATWRKVKANPTASRDSSPASAG